MDNNPTIWKNMVCKMKTRVIVTHIRKEVHENKNRTIEVDGMTLKFNNFYIFLLRKKVLKKRN